MKKLTGIRYGQKTRQKGQSDLDILISLKRYLKKRWHLDFKRELYVAFDKETGKLRKIVNTVDREESRRYRWRNPDLIIAHPKKGIIVIEVDGAVHDHKVEETSRRNNTYEEAHIKLIVLNLADIKERRKTIEEVLDCKMMKLLKECSTGID